MNRKLVAVTGAFMLSLGALYNLSNDSDNFRAVFVNGITISTFSALRDHKYQCTGQWRL